MKAQLLALAVATIALTATTSVADDWNGRRWVSHQQPNDLFYNYYTRATSSPNGTAEMYLSPLPVPAHTGHTYTTYQPLMPHEMMYKHHRSYYTRHPGSGWTRTKVRYKTGGGLLHAVTFGLYDDTKLGWLHDGYFNTRVVKPWHLY